MKKAIIFLLGLILLSAVTNAQNFGSNTRVLSLGIGVWSNYYHSYYGWGNVYRNSPTITLAYEQALVKKAGPGYFGLGGQLAWQSSGYRNNDYYVGNNKYYYSSRYTNYVIAAKLAYHWDELQTSDIDLYGGIAGGFRIQTYRYSTDYTGSDLPAYYGSTRSTWIRPVGALFAGIRWYFKPATSLYAEFYGGSGFPYINVGLAFKM